MRIAVKAVKIVIIPGALNFGFDFIVNSAGSMIYGPLVGLLVGAVSDTIGAVLFPTGAYFFPFIFVEMLSSFIFGLFLYRAKLSSWRVIASRFAVVVVCNFIVNPLVMTRIMRSRVRTRTNSSRLHASLRTPQCSRWNPLCL